MDPQNRLILNCVIRLQEIVTDLNSLLITDIHPGTLLEQIQGILYKAPSGLRLSDIASRLTKDLSTIHRVLNNRSEIFEKLPGKIWVLRDNQNEPTED